ncbi:MAG: bifunctional phosphoglucose/phosphomannose isomerase [Thermincola sp.]|jgi:glucose/mannose-6-phosphate isomerase|nr:bifunctional phosphoglucose/phosphomannose isomerase [Thermincola sp.]MDT3704700.1 bifunctional phosphoglucose/phosphomannose isomerase [Thermincola sp.]
MKNSVDLNNLDAILANDPGRMLEALRNLPEQCQEALEIGRKVNIPAGYAEISNIVVTGLGGSAIGGDFLRLFVGDRIGVPVIINRDYTLPKFIDAKTLIFTVSYSGNTEETLSAYAEAREKGAKIVALTNGGQLRQLAEADGMPVIVVPAGISPRAATGYLLIPTLAVLESISLINDLDNQISDLTTALKTLRDKLQPETPADRNPAKQLAGRFYGKLPVIWAASGNTEVVATRWKGQINENAKAPAYWNIFPELNHNEIVGFEEPAELLKNLEIVMLRDQNDHPRVQKRMEVSREIIQDVVSGVTEVWSEGESRLARLFTLTYIGDFTSVYLATLYGIDPTPVKNIDFLKNKLAQG